MQMRSTSQMRLVLILRQQISVSDCAEICMVTQKWPNGQGSLLCHEPYQFGAFRDGFKAQNGFFLFLGFILNLFSYVLHGILFLVDSRVNLLYKDTFRLVYRIIKKRYEFLR